MSVTRVLPRLPEAATRLAEAGRPSTRAARQIIGAALGLGAGADGMFYGPPPGISALIAVILILGALVWLGRRADVRPVWRNLWLVAPLLFCAAMVAVRANAFLTALNVCACLALLSLLAYFYGAGKADELSLVGYPAVLLLVIGNLLVRPGPLVPAGVELVTGRRRNVSRVLPVVRGMLLAVPVLLVFTGLLASADLVFAGYLGRLVQVDLAAQLPDWTGQFLFILFVAWVLAGGYVYALHRRPHATEEAEIEANLANLSRPFAVGVGEAATLLALVDALFLAFGWIQLVYLFGGQANITAAGYTYADYARRGFFELVVVAVLALGLILCLQALTPRTNRREALVFNGLSTVLVGGVLVLVAAALQRMLLYEEAYGYTELRLYVHVFMIWLAVACAWFVVTLWMRPARFAIGACLAALGFVITLNLINPDATIARENLARYQTSGALDPAYLASLSDDAVPGLVAARTTLPADLRATIEIALKERRTELSTDPTWRAWPAFHLARATAYTALSEMP